MKWNELLLPLCRQKSHVKFGSPQNISGASQQKVDGSLFLKSFFKHSNSPKAPEAYESGVSGDLEKSYSLSETLLCSFFCS